MPSSGLPRSESQQGLGYKLRHMLDPITSNKHASFHATIVIHDLVNVPLVSGDFAVRWKFRGREGGSDSEVPTPQGSSAVPSVNASQTSLPLAQAPVSPSSSSISSVNSAPVNFPAVPNINAPTNAPPKAMSMPPPALSGARQVKKKASDPTPSTSSPLAKSFKSSDMSLPLQLTRSPSDQPTAEEGRASNETSEGSMKEHSDPTSVNLNEDEEAQARSPGVPFPRTKQATTDSVSSELTMSSIASDSSTSTTQPDDQELKKRRGIPRLSLPSHMHRHSSHPNLRSASAASASSVASSNHSPPKPFSLHVNRSRSSINSICSSSTQTPKSEATCSESRKGQTPVRTLKSHCCTWDFRLNQQLRIVVGKMGWAIPANDGVTARDYYNSSSSRATSSDRHKPRPLLGGGPHSASTIKFTVDQIVKHGQTHSQTQETGKRDHAAQAITSRSLFGELDLDLAAFAEKGVVTRRYLLKGSKSNATIKLSIEVKWVSGEENWIAPQIKDGHHVARLVHVPKENNDHLGADLRLTQSNTNSSSSSLSTMTRRNLSSSSIPPPMSRQLSQGSIVGNAHFPAFQGSTSELVIPNATTYKSVDQHLKKRGKGDDNESIKSAKSVKSIKSTKSAASDSEKLPSKRPRDRIKDQLTKLRQPSPYGSERSESPHRHRHHTHHIHHLPVNINRGPTHLPPDYAIEALFNPVPGLADSPFTYASKVGANDEVAQATLSENLRQVVMADEGDEVRSNKSSHSDERSNKLGWGRMRNRITKDKELYHRLVASRTASSQSVVR